VGFQRQRIEGLARRATKLAGHSSARIFRIGEHVPFLVPG
jgi:hypothetical protein